MPGVNPSVKTVVPGVVTNQNAYPQWGVSQTGSGGSDDYTIKEATSAAEKTTLLAQGYDIWFTSDAAAKSYVSSSNSLLNGNLGGLANYVAGVSGFSGTNFVNRALKIVIGAALVIIGVAQIGRASCRERV